MSEVRLPIRADRLPSSEVERIRSHPLTKFPPDAQPKQHVRTFFFAAFAFLLVEILVMLFVSETTFRRGVEEASPPKVHALVEDGRTVYVTAEEKRLLDVLFVIPFVGVPLLIVAGLFAQVALGVPLFRNQ